MNAESPSYVRSFTFAEIDGRCPMHAHGTINGRPWAYRLDPHGEAITVGGAEIVSVAFPAGAVADDLADRTPALVSEQIEFIVQRLLRWAAEQLSETC